MEPQELTQALYKFSIRLKTVVLAAFRILNANDSLPRFLIPVATNPSDLLAPDPDTVGTAPYTYAQIK